MGVHLFILTGSMREDGNAARNKYIFVQLPFIHVYHEALTYWYRLQSAPVKGNLPFTKAHPKWKDDIWTQFGEYLDEQYSKYIFAQHVCVDVY